MLTALPPRTAISFKCVSPWKILEADVQYYHQHSEKQKVRSHHTESSGHEDSLSGEEEETGPIGGLLIHPCTVGAWEELGGFTPLSCSVVSGVSQGPGESCTIHVIRSQRDQCVPCFPKRGMWLTVAPRMIWVAPWILDNLESSREGGSAFHSPPVSDRTKEHQGPAPC